MIDEFINNLRLTLVEMAMKSDVIPVKSVDDILINYDNKKILNIVSKLDGIDISEVTENSHINEVIILLVMGVVAYVNHSKAKANEKYKEFLKNNSNSCEHLIGKEKKICEKYLRRKAKEKKIATLEQLSDQCGKTKDPKKCKMLMKLEIKKLKSKVRL